MSLVAARHRLDGLRPIVRAWPILLGCALAVGFLSLLLGRNPGTAARRNAGPLSARAFDLSGRPVDPFQSSQTQSMVFVFLSVECPVSNSYAPEVRRLAAEFAPHGVAFWLVYPNADETPEAVRQHLQDYGFGLAALRDPRHELTKATGARVTPEAIVFVPGRGFVYRGRIDNRFVELGKARVAPTQHDLKDALGAILSGKPVPQPITRAVGCYISEAP